MTWYAEMAPHLGVSARERLKQTPVRVTMGLLIAWVFGVAGLGDVVIPWLIVSTFVHLFEHFAMEPFRRRDPSELGRALPVLSALVSAGLFSTVFAGAVLIMWRHSDQTMAAIAIMALAGTLVSNIVSGIASRTLFLIGATPYLLALCAMPWIGPAQTSPALGPMIGSVILLVLAVIAIWSRAMGARVSEMQALAEAQKRLEQAETAMADRAAMAAIVSHELRTPVSAILASAQIIRTDHRRAQTADAAALITDAGRLMTGMLNDLLDHSKIEARGMTLEARNFDLSNFVAQTERFWSAPAAEKGLSLETIAPATPAWLRGDPHRLRQVVNNLMSNAIKFTPRGRIALEAEVEPVEGGMRLRLTVRDQGQGIAPEAMARLFTPFAQGSAEVARTYGGTGLGLTVSRDLARLMGGDLTADSVPGQGAAFTLEVLLPVGDPIEDEAVADAAPGVVTRRLRVLAVDDHEVNRRTLALVLQPLEVIFATASDGHEALELLANSAFDVVLMDVNMPGIDGNETTRRLRAADGPNRHVPVIGFSAGVEPAQIAACRAAGMTDWLPKPLEPKALYLALEQAMQASENPAREEPLTVA
jgi:signal transduction histidine kinase/ActR/RegA family two-component response regulator